MKTSHVVTVAVIAVVASALLMWFLVATKGGPPKPAALPASSAAALERPHVATIGSPTARVHIVEFLDPACETCRDFYPRVKKLLADDPEKLRLSVRMVAFHKGADVVVKAIEASKKQGKFWPTLERMLATQPRWTIQHVVYPDKAWEELKSPDLGLDLDRLKADMESPEVSQAFALDAQDAKTMNVKATPEYFVNGRGLPEFGWEPLRQLVADEIIRAYR